jgi:hypothetical protein
MSTRFLYLPEEAGAKAAAEPARRAIAATDFMVG